MKKIILFLILTGTPSAIAQESNEGSDSVFTMLVDTIVVSGNKITEEEIILRELTFSAGDSVDSQTLDYNRERIYSLEIFNHVYLKPDSIDFNKLWIIVEESWYIYPIPFFMLKDRSWDKISYGMDLVIKNFRGRNETLRGRITFGYDPSYYLFYDNPNMISKEDIFFSTTVSYTTARNPSKNAEQIYGSGFDQKFILGQVDIGKRLNLYNRVAVSLYFQYVESPAYYKGISASDDRIDRIPGVGVGYSFDSRDLILFPSDGIFANVNAQFKGFGVNNASWQVYNLDFRQYQPLFNTLIAKWRLASRITTGNLVPYYDYSYLGLGERVRGHFNEQYEGNNLYFSSVEAAYPMIKDLKIKMEFVPFLPNALLNYRFALYAQIFADAGGIQTQDVPFSIDDFHSGYGFGLTFLLMPYFTLRLEYAFDEYKNTEVIIDFGLSF